MKVTASTTLTHNPWGEVYWASGLRENLTSRSYGEGLETGRRILQAPRQSFTRQLAFKRLKSLAQLGHLPKADEQSARAWLYGKLFVALSTEQLIRRGQVLSPCRSPHTAEGSTLSLARVCVRLAPHPACHRTKPHVALCTGFVAPDLPGVN